MKDKLYTFLWIGFLALSSFGVTFTATAQERLVLNNPQRVLDEYKGRQKTLLEQILNYSSYANELGQVDAIPSTRYPTSFLGVTFWISGLNSAEKCQMSQVLGQNTTGGDTWPWVNSLVIVRTLDIRDFNQNGFRITGPIRNGALGITSYRLGDERLGLIGHQNIVMERIQRAWGLAFQECPGRRSAF